MAKRTKNPLNKRLPRELKGELGKYLVIFLFFVISVSPCSRFGDRQQSVKLLSQEKL